MLWEKIMSLFDVLSFSGTTFHDDEAVHDALSILPEEVRRKVIDRIIECMGKLVNGHKTGVINSAIDAIIAVQEGCEKPGSTLRRAATDIYRYTYDDNISSSENRSVVIAYHALHAISSRLLHQEESIPHYQDFVRHARLCHLYAHESAGLDMQTFNKGACEVFYQMLHGWILSELSDF